MRSVLRTFSFSCFLSCVLGFLDAPSRAAVVSFGTGSNQFQMEFVTIGNPGNATDTTGIPNPAGSVPYTYDIGKFEVNEDMITKYNASFGTDNSLVITKDTRGVNRPATSVSWNEAARFVNWLNTSTGNAAAYKFNTNGVNDNVELWTSSDTLDFDATNPFRSKRSKFVLPSYNEWYKAAYYNPNDSAYYDYANGSNTAPIPVASGTADNTAVYNRPAGPADVTQAGGLSPYGVMGLAGNVSEWEESSHDLNLANVNGSSGRGNRGGHWNDDSFYISNLIRFNVLPTIEFSHVGFRVAIVNPSSAAVPEPSMMLIGTLFGLGGLVAKRRMKK